jgi:hypothetical protein
MASKFKFYLKLQGSNPNYQLMWSTNQSSWSKVQPNSPSTTVDSDDELEWEADDATIDNITIQFNQGNIISNRSLHGNNSKKVSGKVPQNVQHKLSDTYTIKVKPATGEPVSEYDPDIKTPTP